MINEYNPHLFNKYKLLFLGYKENDPLNNYLKGLESLKVTFYKDKNKIYDLANIDDYDCLIYYDDNMSVDDFNDIEKFKNVINIPIIFYNNILKEELTDRLINIGINDYIIKDQDSYKFIENKIINIANKHLVNKLLSRIINVVEDSIIIIDKEFQILYSNDSFNKLIKKSDIYDQKLINLFDQNEKRNLIKFIKNKDTTIESVINDFNGVSHFVKINKVNLHEVNKNLIVLILEDITKNKINEEINNRGENRFKVLAEISPYAIMIGNVFGFVTYVNPTFCKLTGFSEEEIIGKHFSRLQTVRGKYVKNTWSIMKQIIEGKKITDSIEFAYSKKDGSTGIGDALISLINVNGKRELIGIVRDITEPKLREEEYENLFKYSPEGIIHLDLEGNIKSINKSACLIVDKNYDELISRNIMDFENENLGRLDNIKILFEKIIYGYKIDPFEMLIDQNNKIKWLEITPSLISVHDEKLGIQIIIRDITNQKEIELKRQKYTEDLENLVEERTKQIIDGEKMATLGKISSTIAHDLKGPLQVINNSLLLIRTNPNNTNTYLSYIEEAVKHSNEMINELNMSVKEMTLKLEEITLEEIIDEASLQIKVSNNINFKKIVKTKVKLNLDKLKFVRVFNNIIKNAIEAMPDGGNLTIIVDENKDEVITKIIDTGMGMSQDKLNNLFRPFQSDKSKGMGLGLMFCKNVVDKHSGQITVDSVIGKGTTFTIKLPKYNESNLKGHEEIVKSTNDILI